MLTDFDSFVVDSNTGDVAGTINNAFQTYQSVRLAVSVDITGPIVIPDGKLLYSESPLYITKQFHGAMCIMRSWSRTYGINWEGHGDVYDGPGIQCEANSLRQQMGRFQIARTRGPCIDMAGMAAGAYSSIGGGDLCLIQRYDLGLPAIQLPLGEPGTTGVRRLVGLSGGGGLLVDLAASNVTMLHGCDTYRLMMSSGSRYALFISNRFAIPVGEVLNVRGSNHRFGFNTTSQAVHFTNDAIGCIYEATNYDAGVVLDPGCAYNQIGHMPLVPAPIDNSGNDLNRLEVTVPV